MDSKSEKRNISRIKPPFGYYGSKQRIASQIINTLPPHNAWVEAFCGSAAITLAKPRAPIEIINDMDGQIINLFKQLRENQEELCRLIALTPYARDEYFLAREHKEEYTPIEKARQFIVATMMTVNGANGGESSGFSFSQSYSRGGNEARVNRWYHLPERLERVTERLRTIRIENRDARELITMFKDRPATLIYLDPPYNIERKQRYKIDIDDESYYIDLLNKCIESKAMIMISGYDNELYNSSLTEELGWTKIEIPTSTRDTSGKDYLRTEVIWINQACHSAQITNRVPIELSKKETQQNKVNPPR